MPYEIAWYIKNRVLLLRFSGNVTIEDVESAGNSARHMIESQSSPVFSVSNIEDTTSVPANLRLLLRALVNARHPMRAMSIVVGADPVARILMNSLSRLSLTPLYYVETFEDALRLIHQKAPTLTDEHPNQTNR